MWCVYFDASALVKRYTNEPGIHLVNEVFRRHSVEKMYCSTMGLLEVVSILVRQRNDGRLTERLFRQAMAGFRAEAIANPLFQKPLLDDARILSAASFIEKHNLNATDTIILHMALELQQELLGTNEALMLWTADKRLARAATTEGLQVFNPESDTLATLEAFFPNTTT
jgi:predicted nucleic acid-binding protein